MRIIRFCLLLVCLTYLVSCGQVDVGSTLNGDRSLAAAGDWIPSRIRDRFSNTIRSRSDIRKSNLAEAVTPKIIKKLNEELEQFAPRVKIISPQKGQNFNNIDISVQLEVENLPLFLDDKLQLGNHLDLILDNEPARKIFNLDEPVILENLSPGTHSIRVFASRPWGESFKNDGAYAQKTFSVLTETNDNRPDANLPLLTYSNPTGTYGAEPILLDFYLTNAPLHAVAENDPDLQDWRIRTTVNGTSFIIENWQPVYLTGLNKGTNWIQLELIDLAGNNIENTFNNTVRVINYDPQKSDTLAKLVTDKISLNEARPIVEQNYYIQPVGTPEIIEPSEKVEPEPTVTAEESVDDIESSVKDKIEIKDSEEDTDKESVISEEKINLSSISNSDTEQVETEKSEQPVIIPAPETKTIDEVVETIEDSPVKEINSVNLKDTEEEIKVVESTESPEIITITEDNLDSPEPIAASEIPQPESAAIAEDEISITIPERETIKTPEQKTEAPVWWKKILVGMRQKIENLVKLLPSGG